MSELNPYQAPHAITPRKKTNWAAIASRTIGCVILLYWLDLVFNSGIISLKLLLLSLPFLVGPSFGPVTKRQLLREMQERAGDDAEAPEPGPPPEEFFRQLEQEASSDEGAEPDNLPK